MGFEFGFRWCWVAGYVRLRKQEGERVRGERN